MVTSYKGNVRVIQNLHGEPVAALHFRDMSNAECDAETEAFCRTRGFATRPTRSTDIPVVFVYPSKNGRRAHVRHKPRRRA